MGSSMSMNAEASSFSDAVKEVSKATDAAVENGMARESQARQVKTEWWNARPKDLPNPGSFDDIRNEVDGMLTPQQFFDGLQFKAFLAPSAVFNLGHGFDLGSKAIPNNYTLFTTYATQQLVMMSRLDLSGRVFGRIIYMHNPRTTSKVIADVGSEPNSSRATYEVEHRGLDYCSQLKLMSDQSVSLSYMQSITPTWSAGGEFAYIGQHSVSTTTLALKYQNETDNASMNVTPGLGMLMMGYVKRLNSASSLAADFMFNIFSRESISTFGYRYSLEKAMVTGTIDSTGKLSTLYEEKLSPGLSLLLSGEADYAKKDFKFGVGFNIGA
uniref:Mitochondrial import receptor subunit TOM40 n=1 Tax=Rhodosorus marinus TaxID=101924 RepID=A0A7S2ZDW8_9RHOD